MNRIYFLSLLFWLNLPCAYAQSLSKVRVTAFENVSLNDSSDHRLFRRDYIRLTVTSLDTLLKHKPANSKIILFIDNIPFDDLEPEFIDSTSIVFKFHKNVYPDNNSESKAWAYFYKKPRKWILRNKNISVGYKEEHAVPSDAFVNIVIIQGRWYYTGVGLIACLLITFILLSTKTSLLRNSGSLPSKMRPYSLARTQFSIWLLLISCAYVFLWISTGELPVLTSSSLILLGISGGTSIVAKVIENSQAQHVASDRKTEGFIVDILSDEKGISIHRLQMVVFTIITGMIFFHGVVVIFEMPDFDDNLLMLMGISNGTYAGFKSTENSASRPVQQ